MSEYRKQLEDWLSNLDVKADVVYDIGGEQKPVKGRTKSWDVKDYHILDLPYFNLDQDEQFPGHANIVFCLEVFEYLINPINAIMRVAESFDDRAYVTFPFVYPHHNELEFDSLRYTEPGIKRLAQWAELKVNNIWYRKDKSGLLKQFYQADGMRMAKEYPNHDVTGFIVEFVHG